MYVYIQLENRRKGERERERSIPRVVVCLGFVFKARIQYADLARLMSLSLTSGSSSAMPYSRRMGKPAGVLK